MTYACLPELKVRREWRRRRWRTEERNRPQEREEQEVPERKRVEQLLCFLVSFRIYSMEGPDVSDDAVHERSRRRRS